MCQKVQFGPQNIVWGLNFGGSGGPSLAFSNAPCVGSQQWYSIMGSILPPHDRAPLMLPYG